MFFFKFFSRMRFKNICAEVSISRVHRSDKIDIHTISSEQSSRKEKNHISCSGDIRAGSTVAGFFQAGTIKTETFHP
jgi:hypothetical protein